MKTIKILGTGCPNCKTTEEIVNKAINELNIQAKVEKVEDIMDIMKYDVMSTPAVVIDEKVMIKGRVPSIGEIKTLLAETAKPIKNICPTTAKNKAEAGVLFVDFRKKADADQVQFAVDKCINIPLAELNERMQEIPKDQEVVLVCNTDGSSTEAFHILTEAGYDNISNMEGGLVKWKAKGFATKGTIGINTDDSCCSDTDTSCCEPTDSEELCCEPTDATNNSEPCC